VVLGRHETLFADDLVESLNRNGFLSVLYVSRTLGPGQAAKRIAGHPGLRILIAEAGASEAGIINCAIRESTGSHVLLMTSSMRLHGSGLSSRFFERLAAEGLFAVAPRLYSPEKAQIPSARMPLFERGMLEPLPMLVEKGPMSTLYLPHMAGIYDRQAFLALGGYSTEFTTPYWQCLDLGLRVWLRAMRMAVLPSFELEFTMLPPPEDRSRGKDCASVWLRNLAPVYSQDSVFLPRLSIFRFLWLYKGNAFQALGMYRQRAAWVRANRFTFKLDMRTLAELWDATQP
jgi:hypothetical protein